MQHSNSEKYFPLSCCLTSPRWPITSFHTPQLFPVCALKSPWPNGSRVLRPLASTVWIQDDRTGSTQSYNQWHQEVMELTWQDQCITTWLPYGHVSAVLRALSLRGASRSRGLHDVAPERHMDLLDFTLPRASLQPSISTNSWDCAVKFVPYNRIKNREPSNNLSMPTLPPSKIHSSTQPASPHSPSQMHSRLQWVSCYGWLVGEAVANFLKGPSAQLQLLSSVGVKHHWLCWSKLWKWQLMNDSWCFFSNIPAPLRFI